MKGDGMENKINLDDKQVRDIRHLLIKKPCVVGPDEPIEAVLSGILDDVRTRHVYVADGENRLIGSVRMNSVVEYLFPYMATLDHSNELVVRNLSTVGGAGTVKDIMDPDPFMVEETTSLAEMAGILIEEKINELPVVDKEKHIIGQVSFYEILIYYFKKKQERKSTKTTG